MLKINLALLLMLTTVLLIIPAIAQSSDPVDDYLQAEMQRRKIPGLALLVVRNGEIVKARGYGYSNVELQVPVKAETLFQSGSMGKQSPRPPS